MQYITFFGKVSTIIVLEIAVPLSDSAGPIGTDFPPLLALQVSLLCLLICVFGLYALLRKKPRHGEEGGVEYNAAVQNRHFLVRN